MADLFGSKRTVPGPAATLRGPSAIRRAGTIAVALALVAGACGGDDSSASSAAGEDSGSFDAESEAVVDSNDAVGFEEADGRAGAPLSDEPGLFPDPAVDENFVNAGIRDFVASAEDPESTFALDVDTGSFTIGRRYIAEQGQLPPADSVRIEEYVNAQPSNYPDPDSALGVFVDGGPSPFDRENALVRVGVQAQRVDERDRPDANLTFVVDTSGSMDRPDRLGLVKQSLTALVEQLDRRDSVAIVTYDANAGVVLPPTRVSERERILQAIEEGLVPGGSTNLEAGLNAGYELARESMFPDGVNRVVLASDGIANVGLTDPDVLARQLREDADSGIQLVTVGFGMDGFNDDLMEQIADQGDGFYAYVDRFEEADRLFNTELMGTLLTVAIDSKVQVEFNPDNVTSYRLLGFENRAILDDDFRNDAVDAGEIGSGHTVTALYELELTDLGRSAEADLGTIRLRWEDPDSGEVIETETQMPASAIEDDWNNTDQYFQLATTTASFAEILRESPHAADLDLSNVANEAARLSGDLPGEPIQELAELTALANELA